MSQGEPEVSGTDQIRFDRAEFAEQPLATSCSLCGEPLGESYFEVNGAVACARCRETLENASARPPGTRPGRFLRALSAGLAAAAVGAGIYYGVRALTGYEFGLIAIVVGLMVGGAVRWGSHGRGGWRYQALAIALTYLSVVSTYAPFVFEAFERMGDGTAAAPAVSDTAAAPGAPAAPATGAPAGTPPATAATPAAPKMTPVQIALGVTAIGFILLAAPFLAGFENFMGWVILGIALYQAWKMNKRRPLVVSGPFKLAPGPAAAPA
jgi:hypothetical protein